MSSEGAAGVADDVQLPGPPDWAGPGVPRPAAPELASPALLAVVETVDALLAAPVSGRPVDVGTVLVLAERLRGAALAGLGELDATGQHLAGGAPSAAVWLRRQQVIGDDTARAAIVLARRLRGDLAGLGALLRAGGTTLEHVRAVAAGTTGLDEELVATAQPALVDLVEATEPARVRRELRERAHAVDPGLARDAARRQAARQGLYADVVDGGAHGGGSVVLGGTLTPEDGAVVLHALDLHVRADRTLAGATGDVRGLPARRAAALVEWARQAALRLAGPGDSVGHDVRTVRSHLLVTCSPEQLLALADSQAGQELSRRLRGQQALAVLSGREPVEPGRLPSGGALTPEGLRRAACDTTLSLVVAARAGTARPRWEPLYVGRSARTISGRQFAALVVRDRQCVVRGCRRRPAQCEAHHVRHWLDGGPSDLDNLVLLCHLHHHDHHDRGHDLETQDGRWITQTGWADDPPGLERAA